MDIRLKNLTMLNFKGVIGTREIGFNEAVTLILGRNKTGKTTVADAILWCLFGKNSEGKADFGIKPRGKDGKYMDKLDHEVTLVLIADGREVTLKRCWVEKWGKPQQQEQEKLLGHTANFFIDGNKYTEKDYEAYISELCPEGLFRALTNPLYFPTLKADKQRELLTKMVDEVSNETIAASNAEFKAMLEDLQGRSLEEYLQHISYKISEVNDELKNIPPRIAERKQDIIKLTENMPNWAKLEADIKATEKAIERIDEEIADHSKVVDSDFEAKAKERKAINALKEKVSGIKYEAQTAFTEDSRNRDTTVRKAENELNAANDKIADYKGRKTSVQRTLDRLTEETEKFRGRWSAANSSTFEVDENEFICPTCKRQFDYEDVESKRESMLKSFNLDKASKLEKMRVEADDIKKQVANNEALIKEYDTSIAAEEAKLPKLEKAVEDAKKVPVLTVAERLADNATLTDLETEITERTNKLDAPVENDTTATEQQSIASLKEDKAQLQQKRDELKKELGKREQIADTEKRIAELEKSITTLNQQKTELEKKDYTAKEFTKAHITELEGKVNALFTNVTFTMFEHKLNGALKPTCECVVDGVPYSDLNNADRINAGIDIINAMQRHNNMYVPCLIDNAESINDVLPMKCQAIHLIVSRDNELVVINN